MGTRGFWGITKNGEEKMIYSHSDSYPEALGKDVVFLIQNNLENLATIFDKLILVKNIDNLDQSEARFILMGPTELANVEIEKKYLSESAMEAFEKGYLEYGYMIDLDKSVLKLYKEKNKLSEINLEKIKFKEVQKIFGN